MTLKNFGISSSAARQDVAASNQINGVRCEAPDTDDSGARINHVHLEGIHVVEQPGHGIAVIGDSVGCLIERCTSTSNSMHGIVLDQGRQTSRTNLIQGGREIRPGIFQIIDARSQDNGGHGVAIGHPDNGHFIPYRVGMVNCETFRNSKNPAHRHENSDLFINCANLAAHICAVSGLDENSNHDIRDGVVASGKSITFDNCRYISTNRPIV